MKVGLITTSIHVPTVLALYRKLDPDVRFFVAGDVKTPDTATEFCASLGNCVFIPHNAQLNREYKCEPLIGKNTIARRNIALLEALSWGADVIVTIDDDNIPLASDYFDSFYRLWEHFKRLGERWYWDRRYDCPADVIGCPFFNGIQATGDWFDVGTLLGPVAPHRGFPYDRSSGQTPNFSHVTSCRVGVAAGICLGDPDVDATTRISRHPMVHRCSELLRSGIVVDPRRTHTVFNSQNTAFIRELAPCFLMVPSYGRYDDIYASLVAQRVMRERGFFTRFGMPAVWQSRNPHDLLADLRAEQWGAEHILEFSAWLDAFQGVHDVVSFLKVMATNLPKFIPSGTQELWLAWLSDCESVMK